MWNVVLEQFLPVFFMIITPPLTVFVGLLFRKLAKKWNLETAMQYDSKVGYQGHPGRRAEEHCSCSQGRREDPQREEARRGLEVRQLAADFPQASSEGIGSAVLSNRGASVCWG
jgi:hypothetical protein